MNKTLLAASVAAFALSAQAADRPDDRESRPLARHVMLISVDGLHQKDLARFVATHPTSTLAELSKQGVTYTDAHTSTPSDSFPGLLSFLTGAGPKTTGIYYDDSYDRTYYAPGSNCTGPQGIEMVYDESIEFDDSQLFSGGINPANLPMTKDAAGVCKPVYPHEALKVNTIFEVVKSHGGLTAYADKHAAYDLVNGPSGLGVDDLYTPEINSLIKNGGIANGVNLSASLALCDGTNSLPVKKVSDYTNCIPSVEAYDDTHIQAAINWIDGLKSDGGPGLGVPELFGFNLQQISVSQKLPVGGYKDAAGTPSDNLAGALAHVDVSIGRLVAELRKRHLRESTLIVISAKHGQSPIDKSTLAMEPGGSGNTTVVDPAASIAAVDPTVDSPSTFTNPNSGAVYSTSGHFQTDDTGLLWLQNQTPSNTAGIVSTLDANAALIFADKLPPNTIFPSSITSGAALATLFGDPTDASDPVAAARAPNVVIQPNAGTIYSGSSKKISEHGGGTADDTNVALLVSMPGTLHARTVTKPVSTTQVAPTILRALGRNPEQLDGVKAEKTRELPGLFFER